jgi:hypothetical protein
VTEALRNIVVLVLVLETVTVELAEELELPVLELVTVGLPVELRLLVLDVVTVGLTEELGLLVLELVTVRLLVELGLLADGVSEGIAPLSPPPPAARGVDDGLGSGGSS